MLGVVEETVPAFDSSIPIAPKSLLFTAIGSHLLITTGMLSLTVDGSSC